MTPIRYWSPAALIYAAAGGSSGLWYFADCFARLLRRGLNATHLMDCIDKHKVVNHSVVANGCHVIARASEFARIRASSGFRSSISLGLVAIVILHRRQIEETEPSWRKACRRTRGDV
jgi:hypothetical protein